jgi:hypothetical protein
MARLLFPTRNLLAATLAWGWSALKVNLEKCIDPGRNVEPTFPRYAHSEVVGPDSPPCRRGQVLALVAIALVVLLGFVALAVDLGLIWGTKRKMQTAADAAVVAGAVAARNSENVTSAADNVASLNGFTDGTNGVTITVTNPYSGCGGAANCIKVKIAQDYPTYFLRVVGYSTININASAVSGTINSSNCVYALKQSASPGLKASGNGTVNLSCGVVVDSNQNPAATCTGSATFTATSIAVTGSVSGTCFSPAPTTGTSGVPDPFAYLGSAPTCTVNNTSLNINSSTTVTQGHYCKGIKISGASTNVTFQPGTYYIGSPNDLSITSGGTVSGTGVTFIDTQGGISLAGSGKVTLSAPTSGTYKGILFWGTSTSNNTIAGGSGSTFDGALYFPNSKLTYTGNSSSTGYTIIAAGEVEVGGGSVLGSNFSSLGGTSPVSSSSLYQ